MTTSKHTPTCTFDYVEAYAPEDAPPRPEDEAINVAIVGKPNAGAPEPSAIAFARGRTARAEASRNVRLRGVSCRTTALDMSDDMNTTKSGVSGPAAVQ